MNIFRYFKDRRRAKHSGFLKQPYDHRDYKFISGGVEVSDSVDLRDKFLPVRDQKNSEACTGFAIASVVEYFLNKDFNTTRKVSPLYIWYFAKVLQGWPEKNRGVWLRNALKAFFSQGFAYEKNCEFNANFLSDKLIYHFNDIIKDVSLFFLEKMEYQILSSSQIKEALSNNLPVWFGLRLNNSFYGNTTGIIKDTSPNNSYHAMAIVGYEYGYYIVRNSWGRNWGDNGYCYIPESYVDKYAYDITCINYKG